MSKKEIYRKLCVKHSDLPIFSQPWYLNLVAGEKNWDILIAMRGEEVAATMPIVLSKKLSFSISNTPPLSKYLGPFFTPKFRREKHQNKLIRELIQQLPDFSYFQQSLHPDISDWLPFHWENFKSTTFFTFLIEPLDDLEKVFQNISSDYRNNKIPKAQSILKITSDKTIEDFYQVQKQTFDRQKIPMPFSLDLLQRFNKTVQEKNAGKMFFAIDDKQQIHSAAYLIWDNHTAYFLMQGDDPKLRNSGAAILLIWHVIQYTKNTLGLNRFDFLGSVIEPITRVRKQFGATRTPYYLIEKHNSFLLKILHEWKRR